MRLVTTALALAVTLVAALAVGVSAGLAAEQRIYVTGFNDGEVIGGTVDDAGEITVLGGSPFASDSTSLEGIAIAPNGKRLVTVSDLIFRFDIPESGELGTSGGFSQPMGPDSYGVTVTPDGKYAYGAANSEGEVRGFHLNKNGNLVPISQEPVEVPAATGLAVSSDGKYLYAVASTDPGTLQAYKIGTNGSLNEISGSPFDTGTRPFAVLLSPNGKFLYVADRNTPAFIHAYRRAANGSLTETTSSPYPADGDNPFGMAISPDGDYLYTANYNSDTISGFSISGDGGLTDLPGSVYPAPEEPAALTFNAAGSKLFVVSGDDPMSIYDVGSDGVPTNQVFSLFTTIADFQSIALTPAQPPKAKLKKVKKAEARDPVKLSAKGSKDDGPILQYAWKFGDGKTIVTMTPSVSHTYKNPGKYRVSVTLTDGDRCSTKFISTGQTPYCNGSKRAKASQKIKVG